MGFLWARSAAGRKPSWSRFDEDAGERSVSEQCDGNILQTTRCNLRVASCKLQVAMCKLEVASEKLQVGSCKIHVRLLESEDGSDLCVHVCVYMCVWCEC